jgi:hypothetical protein
MALFFIAEVSTNNSFEASLSAPFDRRGIFLVSHHPHLRCGFGLRPRISLESLLIAGCELSDHNQQGKHK